MSDLSLYSREGDTQAQTLHLQSECLEKQHRVLRGFCKYDYIVGKIEVRKAYVTERSPLESLVYGDSHGMAQSTQREDTS